MPSLDTEKEICTRYRSYVDGIIISRVRVISIVAIAMYMSINFLDWVTYPAQAVFFLKIRSVCSIFYLAIFFLSFWEKVIPIGIWLADAIILSSGLGVVLMIFSSDGSSSHYYEGLNVIFLGMGVMNSFYLRHNIFLSLAVLASYNLAVFNSPAVFNKVTICTADIFMSCTVFLVLLMTKFYSTQHHQAFLRQEQLDRLSKTDELTKINNRRSFFDLLQNKIESSDRSNSPFYLIIFDVDYFKELNDRWGHSFGDLALSKIVDIFKNNIRSNDCLGRFGGDEFILFLDITDTGMLMRRLTKISQEVTGLNLTQNNQTVLVSISIGAAKFVPLANMTKDQLLEKADQQLLMVKKTNRGQIGIAD